MSQAWRQWEGQAVNEKFLLRQYVGGSEHSAVFLTADPEQGVEKAAIKLVPAHAPNAELQFSQWKEAAKLSHPHLIRLFQTGHCRLESTDLLYLMMEYAELDLSQVLSQRPFPPEETRETFRLILDTLAYLHGKGLVHGHLKPANIMSVGGQLKLSSDGICRAGRPITVRGTLEDYDPPESEGGIYSPAGDVWSLGMVLVELMPQHSPVWVRTEEGDPVLPRTLPAPYYDIARNCLRWDPASRWTIAEISTRLGLGATPVPVPAPMAQVDGRPQEATAKRRYVFPMAVAGTALAVALAGLELWNHYRALPKPAQDQVRQSSGPLTRKPARKRQSSGGARPSQPSLASQAGAQTSTSGVVAGGVRQKVLPNVPQSALNTVQGTVRVIVKVAVGPSGDVTEATLDSPGPSKYFARLALEAARQWKFQPDEMNGQPVSQERLLQFDFMRTAVEAIALQATPGG